MKKRINENRNSERIIRFCKGALDDALSLVNSDDVDSDVIDEVIGTLKKRISILEDYLRAKATATGAPSSLSENQKVTLTLEQLKRLVKESQEDLTLGRIEGIDGYDRIFGYYGEGPEGPCLYVYGANSLEDLEDHLSGIEGFIEDVGYGHAEFEQIWNLKQGESLNIEQSDWYRFS